MIILHQLLLLGSTLEFYFLDLGIGFVFLAKHFHNNQNEKSGNKKEMKIFYDNLKDPNNKETDFLFIFSKYFDVYLNKTIFILINSGNDELIKIISKIELLTKNFVNRLEKKLITNVRERIYKFLQLVIIRNSGWVKLT